MMMMMMMMIIISERAIASQLAQCVLTEGLANETDHVSNKHAST